MNYFIIFFWILFSPFGILWPDCVFAGAPEEGRLYHAQGKRDPFIPLLATSLRLSTGALLGVETVEDIQIEGIVMDADPRQSVVVVNGSMMRTGEEIGSVKVLAIRPEGVQFSVNGMEAFKPLYQGESQKQESDQ